MYFKRIVAILTLAGACAATVAAVSAPAGVTALGHSADAVQPAYWNYE
jgi:hypothetical protein